MDNDEHRQITQHVGQFLDCSMDHAVIGLKILNTLIEEMNPNTVGRSLTQYRKIAVSFRDHSLLPIFQVALQRLWQLANQTIVEGSAEDKQTEFALKLALSCLSYDFIGTSLDEASEDIGTIQVQEHCRTLAVQTCRHARPPGRTDGRTDGRTHGRMHGLRAAARIASKTFFLWSRFWHWLYQDF